MAKKMSEKEIREFINNGAFAGMFLIDANNQIKIRAICATLEALGYDRKWVNTDFKKSVEKIIKE